MFGVGSGWGRTREHPSARLYRALVDTGLAVRATTEWRPRVHPGLFTLHAQAVEGVSLGRLEHAIDRVTERVARSGPTLGEITEAHIRVRRGATLAYEGATRTGLRLGLFATLQSLRFEDELFGRLLRVRTQDVRRAARGLFSSEEKAVVRYEPSGERGP